MKRTPGAIQGPDLAMWAESARFFTRRVIGLLGNTDSVLVMVPSNGDNKEEYEQTVIKAETLVCLGQLCCMFKWDVGVAKIQ